MSLSTGHTLAHYEILEPIGKGGMGEVYRARDTKLGRDVAIKVLPEEFLQDEERLERFEREARILAQLNHANIATLHGLEESDGQQFLVMELVEGETLAERIAKGPIPVDEAVPLFIQIAEGLEAAHEKGIIHRDLKPANIKIGPDGEVKILDFGLAKVFATDVDVSVATSQSPTLTKGTALGAIMGTAAYMSPEQARAKTFDRRADIWAFGVCFFEALTGKRPFVGDIPMDALASVISAEPDWTELDRRAPVHLRALVHRCLRKNARQRLRDIGDARLEMEEAPERAVAEAPRIRNLTLYAAGLAAFCLVAGLLLGGRLRPDDVERSVKRVVVPLPPDVRFALANREIKISPDGTRLVFIGVDQGASEHHLFLRRMDERDARPVPGTEGAFQPFFSPDGEWLGFHSDKKLMKVPVGGGPAMHLCLQSEPLGASWGDDGFIYFAETDSGERNGIYRIPEAGGTPERVTVPDQASGEVAHWWPEILPGGRAILFRPQPGSGISAVSFQNGNRREVIAKGNAPRYAPTGHLLYHSGLVDYAIPFDLVRLETSGANVPLTEIAGSFDVSATGTLAYAIRSTTILRSGELVWVNRDGQQQLVTEGRRGYQPDPRIAPDSRRIAVTSAPEGEIPVDIWTLDVERDVFSRITISTGTNAAVRPVWSGDGSRIFFASNRNGPFEIFAKSSDGTGEETQVTFGAQRLPASVSADGSLLFYRERGVDSDLNIGVLRLDVESAPELIFDSKFNETAATLSPDGKWLAYVSDESGQLEVYVVSFPELGQRQQVSRDGGAEPLWAPNGGELFYRRSDSMMAVPVLLGARFDAGAPVELFSGPFQRGGARSTNTYDVSPDGRRFLMIREPEDSATEDQIHLVFNWFEELKRLVPTDN